MDIKRRYTEATVKTASNLKTVARSVTVQELSSLSLPEIEAVADLVAQMVPAGNVPGVILNGLARLRSRHPSLKTIQRDVNLLFKGVEQTLDRLVCAAVFAGPAAVIGGYQLLLKLAGKDPEDSFPEGTWQFYVSYALREDTARHTNETHGFDTTLAQHGIHLDRVDRMTAWIMAAIYCLHQYDALLENEWRERVYSHLLREVTAGEHDQLYRDWEQQRPYSRGADVETSQDYPAYRRARFDRFLEEAMADLAPARRQAWAARVATAEQDDLPAYCRQMSIRAYLESGPYGEMRMPIDLVQARVAVVLGGEYYLIPACAPGTDRPADVADVRSQMAAIRARAADLATGEGEGDAVQLAPLARLQRAAFARLRGQLRPQLVTALDALRAAPILLNFDQRPPDLPLAELRQTERGVGDHALTIVDTGRTFIFDQSHIFFDGTWGAALAEILTNEALSWAVYLRTLAPARPGPEGPVPLHCTLSPSETDLVQAAPQARPEVGVETRDANLQTIQSLRRLFKLRSDLLELTVNDLLVLYRAVHAASYRPPTRLMEELGLLRRNPASRQAAEAALEAITVSSRFNPAILIPVDASRRSPRDRLYPMTFEVPLGELNLLALHNQVVEALAAYQAESGDRAALYAEFDRLQRTYLAALAGFGQVMSRAKEIAVVGESASVGTIKLLAHLPVALQRMIDRVPGRFDMLNDLIKGREILSNVGAVAPASTLTRFITAKDDNEKKSLVWGVVTDAQGVMFISLRDFRPHVGSLLACGRRGLAIRIAQDYLDAYAHGLNEFVRDLQRITRASRETHSR